MTNKPLGGPYLLTPWVYWPLGIGIAIALLIAVIVEENKKRSKPPETDRSLPVKMD